MAALPLQSVTLIFSPYHVGIRDHAVGAGPTRIYERGIVSALQSLAVRVHEVEIEAVDDFEGEIGRNFEVFRRIAKMTTAARNANSFPIVIAGNCGASVGVLAGLCGSESLKARQLGCVWHDAHDDFNVPDTVLSGYFDSMAIAIMAGECWKALTKTVPGFKPLDLRRFVHVGLRDLNDMERSRVTAAAYPVVWGGTETQVDYREELERILDERKIAPAMVHVDLDSLDTSVGHANKFAAPGGFSEEDLMGCLEMLPAKVSPVSLTVASFDPSYDKDDKLADIAVRGITLFVKALQENGLLESIGGSLTSDR